MIILLFLFGWYFVGAILAVIGQVRYEEEMLVKDIPGCAAMAVLGPVLLIFILAVEVSNYFEENSHKKLF